MCKYGKAILNINGEYLLECSKEKNLLLANIVYTQNGTLNDMKIITANSRTSRI